MRTYPIALLYLHPLLPALSNLAEFVWSHAWISGSVEFFCSLPPSLPFHLLHCPSSWIILTMRRLLHCPSSWIILTMPRRRGISRRGGSTASRGRASHSTPQNVIPIASASPSSPPSSQAYHLPNSSFQTTRFTFHSRLNRPVLTDSITIVLAEEEERPKVSAHSSSSQSQEDSTLQGDMAGAMSNAEKRQEEGPAPEVSTHQNDSNQHNVLRCESVLHDCVLQVVTSTEGELKGLKMAVL